MDEVIKYYRLGATLEKIAKLTGFKIGEISAILKNHYNVNRVKKSLRYTDPVVVGWIEEDRKNGLSEYEISKKYNIMVKNLEFVGSDKDGFKFRDIYNEVRSLRSKVKNLESHKNLNKKIFNSILQGKILEEVGSEFNFTRERIRQRMVEFIGQDNYDFLFGNRSTMILINAINTIKSSMDKDETLEEISTKTGICMYKVRFIIRALGYPIPLPKKSKKLKKLKKHPEIVKILKEGYVYSKVAKLANCSVGLVSKVAALELTDEEKNQINKKKKNGYPHL